MRRIALLVQYDGTDYFGFQVQPDVRTIQGDLQAALSRLTEAPTRVTGASRTDAGVHAMGQVVAFDTISPIPVRRFPNALNAILPSSIRVTGAEEMSADFHPRYQAMRKLYSYRILNRQIPSPFIERYAWRITAPLSDSDMVEGARHLTGTLDFSAFRAAGSSAVSSVRTVDQLDVRRDGDLVEIWIGGSGFLYMMVRIIVGTLVEVGLGRRGPEDAERILLTRDRTQAGRTAPARGLCLVRVDY